MKQVVIVVRYLDDVGAEHISEQQLFDVLKFQLDQQRDEGLLSTTLHVVSGKEAVRDDRSSREAGR